MKVGILGSGDVGKTLARGFASTGHEVKVGSRSPDKLDTLAKELGVYTGSFSEAATFGELNVLAVLGQAANSAIDLAGPANFSNKIVIDATNPLDFSRGMPPGLLQEYSQRSLGEHVQGKLDDAKVVKCFNVVPNTIMFRPNFSDAEMLICGNDKAAKEKTNRILKEFGWAGSIDLGGIENSKWLEALTVLWVLTAAAAGSWNSMFKLVKV